MPTRSPEEIRASIEQNRVELGQSLDRLRGEVVRLTDWRAQLRQHQQQAVVAAGATGFVLGGGLAALGGVLFGRRRRKQQQPENLAEAVKMQVGEFVSALTKR
jgi:LPXTG-motif cell wall-anchored protein